MSCPRCRATDTDVVRIFELASDVRSDEITVFVERCRSCDHRFFAVHEESRRAELGQDDWNFRSIECTRAAWERLDAWMARCPAPRSAGCTCAVHLALGRHDETGRWAGLRLHLGEEEPTTVALSSEGQRLEVGNLDGEVRALDGLWERKARAIGPVRRGWFRVLVLEQDASFSHADYPTRAEAQRHADDAASETDPAEPIARVLDSEHRVVARGVHYATRGKPPPDDDDPDVGRS